MSPSRFLCDVVEEGDPDWVTDMIVMLGCLENKQVNVKTCSISRVPEKIRKGKEEAFSPKVVSIGPFHHRTRGDLQLMEETKWRYMGELLDRAIKTENKGAIEKLKKCSKAIRKIDPVVRASYGGNIELKPEELARIMILDGCFILEHLLKLYDEVPGGRPASPHTAGEKEKNLVDPMTVQIDLTRLENQIPFIVLDKLYSVLFKTDTKTSYSFLTFKQLADFLFNNNVDSGCPVFHFLHLMQLSSIDNNRESHYDEKPKKAGPNLKRCATKLQACGIEIQAPGNPAQTGMTAPRNKFVGKFDLNIEFDVKLKLLNIPPLHIEKGTEVKWRNLIALEQSGIKIGYNFTSYAFFFRGLICTVDDIKLLKAKKVIIVDDPNIKYKKLLALFETIVDGVEQMDSRYSKQCEGLNSQPLLLACSGQCGGIIAALLRTMWWHDCGRVLAWLRDKFKIWILDFKKDYMRNPWVFAGKLAATALLVLTAMQTYYAARGN